MSDPSCVQPPPRPESARALLWALGLTVVIAVAEGFGGFFAHSLALVADAWHMVTDAGALAYAQGRLRRLGVDRALSRAGARQGDHVRIGRLEFDWEPD